MPSGIWLVKLSSSRGVLDAAGAERVGAGLDGEARVGGVVAAEDRAGDGRERVVEAEVDEVGVEDQRDRSARPRSRRGTSRRSGSGARSGTGSGGSRSRSGGSAGRAPRSREGRSRIASACGAVGVEVDLADRPAARAGPRACGRKSIGVERAAPAAPVVGGAAEVAQAADVEVEVVEADGCVPT